MGRQIDLVIGEIHDLNDDRLAGWSAYFAADNHREALEDEIKKLKEQIRRLKNGGKEPWKLAVGCLPKGRLRKSRTMR
mgnify:CR=1 FL=1